MAIIARAGVGLLPARALGKVEVIAKGLSVVERVLIFVSTKRRAVVAVGEYGEMGRWSGAGSEGSVVASRVSMSTSRREDVYGSKAVKEGESGW